MEVFKTYTIWSNKIYSLKYLKYMTSDCKDIGIRKSDFVPKTKFLWKRIENIIYFVSLINIGKKFSTNENLL